MVCGVGATDVRLKSPHPPFSLRSTVGLPPTGRGGRGWFHVRCLICYNTILSPLGGGRRASRRVGGLNANATGIPMMTVVNRGVNQLGE
jgi:hypothetical protein